MDRRLWQFQPSTADWRCSFCSGLCPSPVGCRGAGLMLSSRSWPRCPPIAVVRMPESMPGRAVTPTKCRQISAVWGKPPNDAPSRIPITCPTDACKAVCRTAAWQIPDGRKQPSPLWTITLKCRSTKGQSLDQYTSVFLWFCLCWPVYSLYTPNIGYLKRTLQYYYHATPGEPCKGSPGVAGW